jgi:hypothetical protein
LTLLLEELLSKSQNQSIKDFIIIMDLKPKKKTLKDLIKNAYKENELTKDILAILYKWEGRKVRH